MGDIGRDLLGGPEMPDPEPTLTAPIEPEESEIEKLTRRRVSERMTREDFFITPGQGSNTGLNIPK